MIRFSLIYIFNFDLIATLVPSVDHLYLRPSFIPRYQQVDFTYNLITIKPQAIQLGRHPDYQLLRSLIKPYKDGTYPYRSKIFKNQQLSLDTLLNTIL